MKDKLGIYWIHAVNNLRISYIKCKIAKIKKQIRDTKYHASGRARLAYWKNRDVRLARKRLWQKNNLERRQLQYQIRKLNNKLNKIIQQ
jgi:hypothetical protein